MSNWLQSRQPHSRKFQNTQPAHSKMSAAETISMLVEFLFPQSQRKPARPIPIIPFQNNSLQDKQDKLVWFGHSACLLQLDGKTVFIDPMLGKSPSPIPLFNSRFSVKLPITIEELPFIDIVVLSHDHYDHMDIPSIRKLSSKVGVFLVPLGIKKRLRRLGISPDSIIELDWGQEHVIQDIRFTCTPARHFSGRGLFDQGTTLWCSWVMKTSNQSLFYSGDGGYGDHFKRIGEAYGPFDLTIMECGQYDAKWPHVHMLPEETVQAHQDVQGDILIPVHWGGFTLALHDWNDPPIRLSTAAEARNIPYRIPQIGETIYLEQAHGWEQKVWWSFT